MVARAKSPAGTAPQSILSLYLEAVRDHEALLQQAQRLQASGQRREARVLLKTAGFVQAHLVALDDGRRREAGQAARRRRTAS